MDLSIVIFETRSQPTEWVNNRIMTEQKSDLLIANETSDLSSRYTNRV